MSDLPSTLIKVTLHGPYAMFEHDGAASIFSVAAAWQPGLYLWSFVHNQSHRITRIGAATATVADVQAGHLAALLRGEMAFHDRAARAEGRLECVYRPRDGHQVYLARHADLVAELGALRLFCAPMADVESGLAPRIASALAGHLQTLGGKALAWLTAAPAPSSAPATPSCTVRFYRPVHMASVPDELTL